MTLADDLPPSKRAKHSHADQPTATADVDTSAQSLSAAELGEADRSNLIAPSSKILLRMAAKKSNKGRLSDVGNHSTVNGRNDDQGEDLSQELTKHGETVGSEGDNHELDDQEFNDYEANGHAHEAREQTRQKHQQCSNCLHNERLEKYVKKLDTRMSKVEGDVTALREEFAGLRELLLERLPAVGAQPAVSPSRPTPREAEVQPPFLSRKRRREEAKEKEAQDKEANRSQAETRSKATANAKENEVIQDTVPIKEEKVEKDKKVDKKLAKRARLSRSIAAVPAFDINEVPKFDKFSLSQQIIALSYLSNNPAEPDAPPHRIVIEKLPFAIFLMISESLPVAHRSSLADLRALWSGNPIARKTAEWLPVKLPYLHMAMRNSIVGPISTEPRVGHRNFTMSDPRWPSVVQVPKLTSSIIAAAVGLIKDPTSNTGAFVRDACTICDMQSPDTPLTWRRWLEEGVYDIESVPEMYREEMKDMCGIPFATFLKECKALEPKKR